MQGRMLAKAGIWMLGFEVRLLVVRWDGDGKIVDEV